MSHALDDYRALQDRVTRAADRLFALHRRHVNCARGCYYCCDEITVLPIEIEAVRQWIEQNGRPDPGAPGGPPEDRGGTPQRVHDRSADGIHTNTDTARSSASPTQRCAFLGSCGECTIYQARPVICRTHGLPLSYRVYEYDERGRQLRPDEHEYIDLWCDLNFTGSDGAAAIDSLTDDTRINMAMINEELERLNEAFLSQRGAGGHPRTVPTERRPLAVLLDDTRQEPPVVTPEQGT